MIGLNDLDMILFAQEMQEDGGESRQGHPWCRTGCSVNRSFLFKLIKFHYVLLLLCQKHLPFLLSAWLSGVRLHRAIEAVIQPSLHSQPSRSVTALFSTKETNSLCTRAEHVIN